MHCVNCSLFYDAFLKEATWISDENKARLLEWKGRLDLCMYASRRSPEPRMDVIKKYEPKHPELAKDIGVGNGSWGPIFTRVIRHNDDGHAAKLVRALAHGEDICAAYSVDDPRFRIKGDMWLQLGHMGKLPQDRFWIWLTTLLSDRQRRRHWRCLGQISRISGSLGEVSHFWLSTSDLDCESDRAADSLRLQIRGPSPGTTLRPTIFDGVLFCIVLHYPRNMDVLNYMLGN